MSIELVKRILSSIILLPLVFYILITGSLFLVFFIILCFILTCYEWNKMNINIYYKITGFIFLMFSFFTFYDLSIEISNLIFVILICVSSDIGGFVFGRLLKGPKITKISPNKTYAGMIGAYLLSLIYLSIIVNYIDNIQFSFQFIFITILLSTISQVGDIIVSYFKRQARIKNTGSLIPGHGGLLDRIDGMIFAVPALYLIELTGYINI